MSIEADRKRMDSPRRKVLVLALFWFCSLGAMGILLPFYSLYLRENARLRASEVGWILSIIPLVTLVTHPLWGWLSDRTGSRRGVLMLLCGGSVASFALIGRLEGFWGLALGTAAVATFFQGIMPMATGVSLAVLSDVGRHAFGYARSFGTAGFLASVVTFPFLMEAMRGPAGAQHPNSSVSEPNLGIMFVWMAVLCFMALLVATALPRTPGLLLRSSPGDAARLLNHSPLIRFLFLLLLLHFYIRAPINLLPLLIREKGGDVGTVAIMWLLMLIVEIPLIARSGAILDRIGPRNLVIAGILSEGLRWTLSAATDNLYLLVAVQSLHGVGVTGILVGGPFYLEATVPKRLRSTAMAWASVAGASAGAVASNVVGGLLFETLGAEPAYLLAGLGALSLALLAPLILPVARQLEPQSGR